jgi:uncharacterized membrane protein
MPQAKKLPFISIDENGRRAGKLGEEWAKWVLDALRSFVVVAFLFYAAEKSGKWYMWALALIGFFALYMFLTAYIGQAQFNFRQTSGYRDTLLKLFLMVVALVIVAAFSLGSLSAVQAVLKEIASLQGSR